MSSIDPDFSLIIWGLAPLKATGWINQQAIFTDGYFDSSLFWSFSVEYLQFLSSDSKLIIFTCGRHLGLGETPTTIFFTLYTKQLIEKITDGKVK